MKQYDKGFNKNNIIGVHEYKIKSFIKNQLNDKNDIFINTTWIRIDHDLKKLTETISDRTICYSGADWENTECRKKENDFINKNFNNVIRIGNTRGKYYFSFWLDFVFYNLKKYQSFDFYNLAEDIKPFMCLNRKPHTHRVKLVESINHLSRYGYISLGSNPPMLLKGDVVNKEGDDATTPDCPITNDITTLGNPEFWNSHFLNVVSETTIHSDVFISEKTLKPIIGKRPFIILGDNNVYDVLHEWGIDTFDDLFGNGYKNLYYDDRIKWITENLENICKEKSLNKLLIKLKPRLEQNFQQILIAGEKNRKKLRSLL